MKKTTIILLFSISIILIGCNLSIKQVAGTYVKSPTEYVTDCLIICTDHTNTNINSNIKTYIYHQKLYNKKTGELIYKHSDYWYLKNNRINFNNFYSIDANPKEYPYSKKQIESGLMSYGTEMDGKDIIAGGGVNYKKIK